MNRVIGYRSVQVLAYVRSRLAVDGDVPSYTELRDMLGFSDRSKVCRVVARLEARGLLARSGQGREKRIRLVA